MNHPEGWAKLNLWYDGFYKRYDVDSIQSDIATQIYLDRALVEHYKNTLLVQAIVDPKKVQSLHSKLLHLQFPWMSASETIDAEKAEDIFRKMSKVKIAVRVKKSNSKDRLAQNVHLTNKLMKAYRAKKIT